MKSVITLCLFGLTCAQWFDNFEYGRKLRQPYQENVQAYTEDQIKIDEPQTGAVQAYTEEELEVTEPYTENEQSYGGGEIEINEPFTEKGHPYGEDGLEVDEPDLSPLHEMFYYQFEEGDRICSKPEDCNPGECCVVGMERYSVPKCRTLGRTLELCVPHNQPYSTDLYYPRGISINVTDIYRFACPCQQQLSCLQGECHPQDNIEQTSDNTLGYIDP